MTDNPRTCSHCGSELKKWRIPEDTTWSEEFFLVCFNDDCPYYKQGWEWMKERYNQHASYRYALNPETGATLMIPVWSKSATRELILDESPGGNQ